MNTVKRAIINAAGIGKRMRPVTLDVPKPLVKVNGTRFIDTIILGLHSMGIREIYIVVGYLKEQFEVLKEEYEGIILIGNPDYAECNNISSLFYAREHLEDVIILDGDLIIKNQKILEPEFEKSGYNAVWTDDFSDEWVMQVENNKVVSCSRDGGKKGWILYSISRWTKEDGVKLKHYLELEYLVKKNRQIYWDDIAMFCHFDDFDLGIKEMDKEDVLEIDDFKELVETDKSYAGYAEEYKYEK